MRDEHLGAAPHNLEIYELPATITVYSKLAKSTEHNSDLVLRPSVAAAANYENVTKAYIQALHSVLTKEKAPGVAAAELERELVKITGFKTGAPSRNEPEIRADK
jgi:hypothetical protein